MTKDVRVGVVVFASAMFCVGPLACSGTEGEDRGPSLDASRPVGSGGSGGDFPVAGGAANSGGASLGAGGDVGAGGADANGGTGGSLEAGGPDNSGGASSSGGSDNSGGVPSSGGSDNSGGVSSSGGMTGSGGAPSPPSSGCGAATFPQSGTYTLDVDGTTREYLVSVPSDYDVNTAYKLVFAWHGLGGTAQQISLGGFYGLRTRSAGSTIFVAGQGLQTSTPIGDGPGWPNTNGRDVAFVRSMLTWLRANYCIDNARIFSTGMSFGGIMSNTVGCQLGEDFRAIAPMAGSGPSRFATCVGQVAAWLTHGNTDMIVTFPSGEASRDFWRNRNNCSTESSPVAPSGCVAYQGCDADYPVHWCEFNGGHIVPSFASEAIWNFFSQF